MSPRVVWLLIVAVILLGPFWIIHVVAEIGLAVGRWVLAREAARLYRPPPR